MKTARIRKWVAPSAHKSRAWCLAVQN